METNGINNSTAAGRTYLKFKYADANKPTKRADTSAIRPARTRDSVELSETARRSMEAARETGPEVLGYTDKETVEEMMEQYQNQIKSTIAELTGTTQKTAAQKINADMVSSAAKYIDQLDRSNVEEGTTFLSFNEARAAIVMRVRDVIRDYYSEQHKENLSFGENAEQHIRDKYVNSNSAYFRADLSEDERKYSMDAELKMLRNPGQEHFDLSDPYALKSIGGPMTQEKQEMWANQLQHNQVSDALQQLFEDNGIRMPEGASVTFSVNPYDYTIDVSALGLVDNALVEQIRAAVNQGQNGQALYSMLYCSNPARLGFEEPEQYGLLNQEKTLLYHMVKDLTGYDVRTLAREGDTFLAPDGRDLWEVMEESAKTYKRDDGGTGISIGEYKSIYQKYAREGWGGNESLSIEYRDGHLYDVGTEYGYGPGQTDWQADLLINYAEIAQRNMARIAETATPLNVQGRADG